jgi:hypothetical protein
VRDVRRALDRLLTALEVGTGQEPSPRLDARALVAELACRRVRLSRCRREELERPLTVVAVDVSGSCAAAATETLAAALALAYADERCVVVRHTNGCVASIHGCRARELPLARLDGQSRDDWWRAARRRVRVAGLVAFGDADAGDVYRDWCEAGVPLVWLDSYAARDGTRPVGPRSVAMRCRAGWTREPLAHWIGVNDAVRAAVALRAASRRSGRA